MTKSKVLRNDAVRWVLFLGLTAFIAFSLLTRDKHRSFGGISFGAFPAFQMTTVGKEVINDHILKGKVWAVHMGTSPERLNDLASRLSEVGAKTASGRRHLYVLTIVARDLPLTRLNRHQYIGIDPVLASTTRLGPIFEDSVFLLDQNAVIRGKYRIDDPHDFKKFQRDLLGVL